MGCLPGQRRPLGPDQTGAPTGSYGSSARGTVGGLRFCNFRRRHAGKFSGEACRPPTCAPRRGSNRSARAAGTVERGEPRPGRELQCDRPARLLRKVGLFCTDLPACEDWDMWLRLAKKSAIAYVDSPLVACRTWLGQSSANSFDFIPSAAEVRAKNFPKDGPLPRSYSARWERDIARRQVAAGQRGRSANTSGLLGLAAPPASWPMPWRPPSHRRSWSTACAGWRFPGRCPQAGRTKSSSGWALGETPEPRVAIPPRTAGTALVKRGCRL